MVAWRSSILSRVLKGRFFMSKSSVSTWVTSEMYIGDEEGQDFVKREIWRVVHPSIRLVWHTMTCGGNIFIDMDEMVGTTIALRFKSLTWVLFVLITWQTLVEAIPVSPGRWSVVPQGDERQSPRRCR